MNPYTISGLLAGAVLGFLVGRAYSERFRYEWQAQQAYNTRKNYRYSGRAGFVLAVLFVAGVLLFGYLVP